VAIRTNYWTVFNGVAIGAPLALWLPFLLVLGGLCGSVTGLAPLCGLLREVLGTAGFWLAAVLLAPAASLLVDFIISQFQRLLAPRNSQILQVSGGPKAGCRQLASIPSRPPPPPMTCVPTV
jgi:hypothetical protein